MRLIVQRVGNAKITINNEITRQMQQGLVVYLGIKKGENINVIDKAISKLLKLRFFENEDGKLKLNVQDVNGSILVVSNFSLYARYDKGTSLSFDDVEDMNVASLIYDEFVKKLKSQYSNIITGEYRTNMDILSLAQGPINVILEF